MRWFDKLKKIIDVHLDLDLVNIDNRTINVTANGGDTPVSVSEDDGTVDINLDALEEDERAEVMDVLLKEGYREEGRIFKEDTNRDLREVKKNQSKGRIQETLDFFKPIISDRHLKALEAALYLREAWEQNESIDHRKQDIEEKFGPEGRSIANLCTAGYFDEERYLRQLYDEMRESEDYKEGNYQKEFEEIVENEPFSVFVSRYNGKAKVKKDIVSKLRKYRKYGVQVKFIDVRGIGRDNKRTITSVMEELEDELDAIEYEPKEDGQYRVRIDPESVDGLEDL